MIVLFDGSNVMRRALAVGKTVPAATAITERIVKSNLRKYRATHAAFLYDPKGKTFRHELYKQYKAGRKRDPETDRLMKELTPRVKERLDALGVRSVRKSGYEADDLIAAFAIQSDMDVTIVSNDKDMAQLINDRITLVRQDGEVDVSNCVSKIGADPDRVVCFLMAIGDSIDNVPGVEGVGPVAARKLISTAEKLEDSDLSVLNKGQQKEFAKAKKRFKTTRKLITLRHDCIEVNIGKYKYREKKQPGFMGV